MANPTNNPNAGNAGSKAQVPNAPTNTGRQDAPKSNPSTQQQRNSPGAGDAPRNEQGNRSNPNPSTPRYDDRPEQRKNEQAGAGDAPKAGEKSGNPGTPNYGDTEPNDPRRRDVDAGTGSRQTSGDRTNRS